MPHRCMNCGNEYEEDSEELIEGCECGSSLFIYEKENQEDINDDEVLKEVEDFLESVKSGEKEGSQVVVEPGSITVEEEGVYSIDLKKLLTSEPLIVEVKDDRYYLHLASLFGKDTRFSKNDLSRAEQN